MKKIVTFIFLMCMVLTFSACTDKESAPPEITFQNIYDVGNLATLLKNHDSVHVLRTNNGELYQEEYYNKECNYTFYKGEEFDDEYLLTDHSYYVNSNNVPFRLALLTPSGMVDMKDVFAQESKENIFSTSLLNDVITSVTEKDGRIIVTSVPDQEELDSVEGLVSCEEELVLDAKTREPISVKSVFRYEDEVYEGIATFIYDAEIPKNMKPFMEYDQQTEDMRTVTVVSNPGTENEKTDRIQSPKGIIVGLTAVSEYADRIFTIYADAACTQTFEEAPDVNSDITVYIKWDDANEAKYRNAFELIEKGDYDAAYALFIELGNYKDAAKEAAKFHYVPTGLTVKSIEAESTETDTINISYNENNLVSQYVITADTGDSSTAICTYDENGRLIAISFQGEDAIVTKREFSYSPGGDIIKDITTFNDGFFYSYEFFYDENGEQVKCVYEDGNEKKSYDCLYNEDGTVSKFVLKDESGNMVEVEEYLYNEKGQNVKINYTENGKIVRFCDYTYNEEGYLIREYYESEVDFSYTNDYTYDANGNIIKEHTTYKDNTESLRECSFKLVYVPFEYSEDDWNHFIDTVFSW